MVTFCTVCGTSLPLADLLIKGGKELTSPEYRCPECGDFAAEEAHDKKAQDGEFDLGDGEALVIQSGSAQSRPAAEALAGLGSAGPAIAVAPPPRAAAPPPPAVPADEDVVMPPDTDLMQPNLPLVPAVDEEVQEDLPESVPEDLGEEGPASDEDEDLDFIERPE